MLRSVHKGKSRATRDQAKPDEKDSPQSNPKGNLTG